jgi:lipoprotein Spr
MVKKLIPFIALVVTMASCSSLKPLNFTNSKPAASASTVYAPATEKKQVKFLEEISVDPQPSVLKQEGVSKKEVNNAGPSSSSQEATNSVNEYLNRSTSVEKASAIQLKYSVLLNTEVEQLEDTRLLEQVDEWYGTRYRMGGMSKSGIDCSAFVQAVYLSAFAVSVPRTAREQYRYARIISATELKEGDLVFFNTTGGVSHVGIYLRNNKFIHASSSKGVTVSDLFEPYYLRRYIGAGRIEKPEAKLP